MDATSIGNGTATVTEALAPCLSTAEGRAEADARLLEEQLAAFFAHRGLATDERGGRVVVAAPAATLTTSLVWTFVADHLLSHVALPARRLGRLGRLLEKALLEAGARGHLASETAGVLAGTCRRAIRVLPRLDRFARSLRAHVQAGRPGPDLFRRDREAYAVAMRSWEASRPVADLEVEGGFVVRDVLEHGLRFSHPALDAAVELHLPRDVVAQAREGDRVDALLGRHRDEWFVMDSFAVAAGVPPDLEGGPPA